MQFLVVYTAEAHPEQPVTIVQDGHYVPMKLGTGDTFAERCRQALLCGSSLGLSMPIVVDGEDNAATTAYSAWPERVVIVDRAGSVAFMSTGGNPSNVSFDDVDNWLWCYSTHAPLPAPRQ